MLLELQYFGCQQKLYQSTLNYSVELKVILLKSKHKNRSSFLLEILNKTNYTLALLHMDRGNNAKIKEIPRN